MPVDPEEYQLPPIAQVMGEDYPLPGQDTAKKVAFVRKLIETTNPIAFVLAKNAARNANYASGRMWIAWNNSRREYRELPLEDNEIRVSMNHIRPMLRARTQRILSAPVDPVIVPDSNAMEQRDRAKVGVNFLRARYRLSRLYDTLDTALEYAYYGGVAALKSFWNPQIGPLQDATLQVEGQPELVIQNGLPVEDPENPGQPLMQPGKMEEKPILVEAGTGQVRFAAEGETPARYRLGDTDTALRTIYQIRLNPEATGWRQADGLRYLIDIEDVPLSVAKSRFPHLAAKLGSTSESKPTSSAERAAATAPVRNPANDLTNSLGLSSAVPAGGKQEPTVMIAEYWELPGPYFRGGRCISIVGDQEAYDGDFPEGVFPYDPVYDEPAPGWWPGRACVNDMIDPSDVINRQWTAINQEMWDQGIGQFISLDVPGVPNQLGREPRLVVKIPMRGIAANRGIKDVFSRIDHPPVATDRWRMIETAERVLFNIGSYHEVTRGQTPPGVDSGVAIERLVEQEKGQLKKTIAALEQTIISWSRKQLAIARRRYGETKRWIPVDRPDMGYMAEGVTGLDLPDPDQITIELDSFKPRSEAAFSAQIMELLKGNMLPLEKGLRLLDLGRGVEGAFESQTRHYAKARQENLWIERGIASMQQLGLEPALDPVSGAPMEDPENPGQPITNPVLKVVAPENAMEVQEPGEPDVAPPEQTNPEQDPEAPLGRSPDGAAWVPLCLPLDDDHLIHMDVLDELVLDVTRPFNVRQLAMAHKEEHRAALAQQQAEMAMQQAAMAPPEKGAAA